MPVREAIAVPRQMAVIEVTFRFYGQLNDFLPRRFRQRRFTHVIPGPASLKDAIEAVGVPHPEADVVLVNGKGEDFAYRLADGDDVAVYPMFRSIDVAGLPRVGVDPPQPVRFVLDAHLRKLASLLRLCGFDAMLVADDADVANVSAHDGWVALTRDVGVLKRSVVQYGYGRKFALAGVCTLSKEQVRSPALSGTEVAMHRRDSVGGNASTGER